MNTIIEENNAWIEETWVKLEEKLSHTAVKSRYKLPYTTVEGVHDNKAETNVNYWTNGFWGGLMWLMYKATGNEEFKMTAECSEKMLDEALKQYEKLDHDVGFMWHLVTGANYRITGNREAYVKNMFVASVLFSRYNIDGDFIRAWNGKTQAGYSIIDCLMNLPLLYWASDELGDERFRKIAMRHMNMALRDHIRPDGSVNHIVNHEVDKVGVIAVVPGQGYHETTCWTRGLAWAIYGSIISYIHTGKAEYLEAAQRTADYFIAHCKETAYLPVIDFGAPKEPVLYDSTAGACAASGILEIAKYVSEEEGRRYTQEAINILKAIDANFCNYSRTDDAIVHMGSERYPRVEAFWKGVHIPIIYGDFFFTEAILKLKGSDFFIW